MGSRGRRPLFGLLFAVLFLGAASPAAATLLYETQWGSNGTDPGQFQTPEGVAGGAGGAVYVADSLNDRIQKFDADGSFLTTWGVYGTAGDGKFSRPSGVATDFAGNVYVADSGNHRIQKFDANGVFLAKFGSFGVGNGQFNYPYGVATDATGNLYVADSGNNRIQKFDPSGTFLFKWGTLGNGNSQFNAPNDVALDAAGDVYVTDSFNYRVKKFDSNGAFLTAWGSQGSGQGQFNVPYGIEVDSTVGAIVSDSSNHRVQRFTTGGGFLSSTGTLGSGDGQFKFPTGVGAGSGKVYVGDSGNDRIQRFEPSAVIEVRKDAVPDDPQDFDFTTGGGLSPASFQLDDDGNPANELSNSRVIPVAPGSGYSVSETVPAGWDLASATCSDGSPPNNIDVSEGEDVTCTFTNNKRAQIVVVQDTQPDDPQDFDYTAGGGLSPTSFQLDDDGDNSNALSNTRTFDGLAPGSGYSVSQTTPGGWSAADITCSDGSPASNVDVSPGEVVTCTFVNVTPTAGRIKVVKDAQPDDPQDFDFTAGGGLSPSTFQLDDDGDNSNALSNQRAFVVTPGSGYSVSETAPSGWVLASATCSDGSPISDIDVSAGEQVTCTFTNQKHGTVVVVKDVQPTLSNQDFDFTAGGGLSPTSFQLDDDNNATLSHTRTFAGVTPAVGYSISETVPEGWEQISATCSDGSPVSNIDVGPGETVTCTFVNRRLAIIQVVKDARPDDPQDFTFNAGPGLSPSTFLLDNDGDNSNGLFDNRSFLGLQPGNYSVSEVVPAGWTLQSATCTDGSPPSNINLSVGEFVQCVFVNQRSASITVVQDTRPDGPQDFPYTTSGLSPTNFQLDDDGTESNPLSSTRTFSNLNAGTYSVSQATPPGWVVEGVTCSDGSSPSSISLSTGEQVTCTFVNSEHGKIVVRKDAQPDHFQDFSFTTSGLSQSSFQLDDDGNEANPLPSSLTFIVDPGSGYSVAEAPPPDPWTLDSATCSDGSPVSNIDVALGETVICTFVNKAQGIVTYPRPKGATPLRAALVPAYKPCTAPNRTHGPPLAFPSCNPPVEQSSALTIGTPDANGAAVNSVGIVRYDVNWFPGGVDDTDVQIGGSVLDVRCKAGTVSCGNVNAAAGADYTGQLRATTVLRITDPLSTDSATVQDIPLNVTLLCANTANTSIGGQCDVNTTVDTLIPGAVPEGRRSVWAMGQVQVFDGGNDGDVTTIPNTLFMVQGYFTP